MGWSSAGCNLNRGTSISRRAHVVPPQGNYVEQWARTGINRMTLSKIANRPGYSTVTDNLDKLCAYFGCGLGDLGEFVPDSPEEAKGV